MKATFESQRLVAVLLMGVIAVAGLALGACNGEASHAWSSVRLESREAKPLEFVTIEGLPDELEAAEVYAQIRPVEGVDQIDESFPGVVYPQSEGRLTLVAPYLAQNDGGTVEVYVTDGDKRSNAVTLDVEAIDVREGAFTELVESFNRTVDQMMGRYGKSEDEFQEILAGEAEVTRSTVAPVLLYHLVSNPENPNALVNWEPDEQTRRMLNGYLTRAKQSELQTAVKNALAPDMAMGGGVGPDSNRGFGPVEIDGAAELSKRMKEFQEIDDVVDDLQLAQNIGGIYLTVVGLALSAGGATGVAGAVSSVGSLAEINARVAEWAWGTRLGELPCCIETVDAQFERGGVVWEDEQEPQTSLTRVGVTARSKRMNFDKQTRELATDMLKRVVGEASGEVAGQVDALNGALGDTVGDEVEERVINATAGEIIDEVFDGESDQALAFRWNVVLESDGVDGKRWLKTELQRGSMLEPYNGPSEQATAWSLREEAYEKRAAVVRVLPDPEKFPVGTYATLTTDLKRIELKPIDLAFEPAYRRVDKGKTYEFSVRVKRSEDPAIAEIGVTGGEITEKAKPGDGSANVHTFTWRSPEAPEAYPVSIGTRSTSDEGLRGELSEPPARRAHARIYNENHVGLPSIGCMRTGETRQMEASVAPPDQALSWSTSAGSLEIDDSSHSATFRAPESPGEVTVTVEHADDPEASDSATVRVDEDCRCHYSVTVLGHRNWSGSFDTSSRTRQNMPMLSVRSGDSVGSVSIDGGGSMSATVAPRPGYEFPEGALESGETDFPAIASASDEQIPVYALMEAGAARLEWFGEFHARITVTGTARVSREEWDLPAGGIGAGVPRLDEEVVRQTRFRADIWPVVQRISEEGSVRFAGCEGNVQSFGDGVPSADDLPFGSRGSN